jgi:hypothetical protein
VVVACASPDPAVQEVTSASPAQPEVRWFEEVTAEAGFDFKHDHGGSGRRYMVETMAGGGGFLDLDGDGWLDVYLVQGQPLPGRSDAKPLTDTVLRNRNGKGFEDHTARVVGAEPGYGMGACFADIDNSGTTDVYVTRFGPDLLLSNQDGRLVDATAGSGVDNPDWAASCAFADYDRDGCLDLYVVNYVDFSLNHHIECREGDLPVYCHPDAYEGVPDLLYRGHCDGTFSEVSAAAGLGDRDPQQGKGLGVVWTDLDGDGHVDLYVSNDSTRNFLYRNRGDGTFMEIGALSGSAFNERGMTEAGMGVDAGDVDGDGHFDLFVANLDFETNTFYRNQGGASFGDETVSAGLAAPSLTRVGFGVDLFDADNDGDLDLFIANGHIIDNIHEANPTLAFAQPDQLFQNRDGRFEAVGDAAGDYFKRAMVGRGAAVADVDADGDLDLLVTNCNEKAVLLANRIGEEANSLLLRLVSHHGRDAIGARATVRVGDRSLVEEVRAGTGYLSQGDLRLHFGLGQAASIEDLEIRWPEGDIQRIDGDGLGINHVITVYQRSRI